MSVWRGDRFWHKQRCCKTFTKASKAQNTPLISACVFFPFEKYAFSVKLLRQIKWLKMEWHTCQRWPWKEVVHQHKVRKVVKQRVTAADFHLSAKGAVPSVMATLKRFAVPLNALSYLVMKTCVWGAPLCWLSHIQQCCCGCKTASGISMYKQAYKWSTIWLFIFILLTVNKAEQALTPSNKWRPTHANSAAAGNRGGLFELRSILFRLHWSQAGFFFFFFLRFVCWAFLRGKSCIHVFWNLM